VDGRYDPDMFTMLRGPWPRALSAGVDVASLEADVRDGRAGQEVLDAALSMLADEAVAAQVEAGCELVTDGQVDWADPVAGMLHAVATRDTGPRGRLVRAFLGTAGRVADTGVTAAQVIPGPYTLALRDVGAFGDLGIVNGQALAFAEAMAGELDALRDAGCSVVIVDEPAASAIRSDQARDGWIRAHRRMLRDAADQHLMLAVTGGDAPTLRGGVIATLPYASLLLDLVGGPDTWYLARELPGERGVVCAALAAAPGKPLGDQSPQLVWAAQYAASMGGRGLARVGLANASSLGSLSPAEARAALDALAVAARYAVMTREEALAAGFNERAWRTMPGRSRPRPGG
jgi:hypothetical protein